MIVHKWRDSPGSLLCRAAGPVSTGEPVTCPLCLTLMAPMPSMKNTRSVELWLLDRPWSRWDFAIAA